MHGTPVCAPWTVRFCTDASRMFRWRWRRQQSDIRIAGGIRGQIRENRDLVICGVICDAKGRTGSAGLRLRSSRQIIALAIHRSFVSAVCAKEICVDVIFLCQGGGKHRRFCGRAWNRIYRGRNLRGLFGCLSFCRIIQPCFALSGCAGQISSGRCYSRICLLYWCGCFRFRRCNLIHCGSCFCLLRFLRRLRSGTVRRRTVRRRAR